MARFLFTCWSFPGHVFQPLAIAQVLRERGHECAFYSGPRAARTVEGESFPFFPSDKDEEDAMYDFMFAPEQTRTVTWRSMLEFSSTVQRWLLGAIPQQVEDMERIIRDWRADMVVTEQNMWAPMLVLREKDRIPVAVLAYFSCMIPGPDAPPFGMPLPPPRNWYTRLLNRAVWAGTAPFRASFRRAANAVRQRYGLAPLKTSVLEFTGTMPLYLVMGTTEFDYNRRDLPPSVHYVGACLWDKPRHEKSSDWLNQLPTDQPWVHASEGTVHVVSPFVLAAAAQGLGNRPMQVILTTGGNREPSELDLGPIAPNVHVVRWVSHTELLPRLAVMITTGGSATVQATLRAGVPLIVVPTDWDKPDIARRVAETGAGLYLDPKQCTPEGLRAAVEKVLGTPSFRQNAQRMAAAFARYPGPPGAADQLERLSEAAHGPVQG
ncbi:MAG TPA: nucleotide disphospho-sugar-binding domain-containing protein [Bryobacteraceae bacterium]|nr:nucleotide disphospho-sugar-binding domain-containing protein [Bryobacteraceae bacterium]